MTASAQAGADLHNLFWAAARAQHQRTAPGLSWDVPPAAGSGERPGDDFNRRGDWPEILLPHGWKIIRAQGDVIYWRRPGKTERDTWSATTGYCKAGGLDHLYVFSSSAAPFETGRTYTKFGAYCLLNHSGDYKAAARALAGQGYGEQRARPQASQQNRSETNGHHANGHAKVEPAIAPLPPAPWEPPIPLSEVPEPPPFPLGVLPDPLRAYVEEAAWAVNCPPDFVAAPMLAIAGAAIGNTRRLAITRTHTQSACLFAIVIGDPGSGKSPALLLVAEPLESAEERFRLRWQQEMKTWEQRDDQDEAERPQLRRVLLDDTTTERMVGILGENPRGLCMVRDEMAALVGSLDQYKAQGKGSDRQVYLKLWAGAPIRVDRKNNRDGAPVTVRHPFVGIVGGIQPTVVEQLRGDRPAGKPAADDGFLDRFLFAYPTPKKAIAEDWRELSPQTETLWSDCVDQLLALPMIQTDAGRRPYLHRLSPCGRDAWVAFTAQHAREVNDEGFPRYLIGPWAKLKGYCARLALILHHLHHACADGGGSEMQDVEGWAVERAAQLTAYFKLMAQRMCCAMDADPEVANCRDVLRWAERADRKEFKPWEVIKDLKTSSRFAQPEDLDRTLLRLQRHNYLRCKLEERKATGRRPSPTYELNPLISRVNGVNRENSPSIPEGKGGEGPG